VKLLAPLAALYGGVVSLRAAAYRGGLLPRARLAGPVISVGNLSVGGSGKTPVVQRIAEILLEAGLPVAILSRGYRGSFSGEALVVSDGRGALSADAALAGDEPVMLARALPSAVVAVGAHRDRVGRLVEQRFGTRVHVLDDGFQHLRLVRDLDVLCVDAADLGDRPLPAGRLREFASAAARADVILTNGSGALPARAFRLQRRVLGLFDLAGRARTCSRPWLVSGIARPERFHADAETRAGRSVGRDIFPDHHAYSAAQWQSLVAKAKAAGADAIVTTAKDAVRLPPGAAALPVLILGIAAEIEDEARFRQRLLAVARRLA
jgi:tetraacyldisaccharide 4'-kinase